MDWSPFIVIAIISLYYWYESWEDGRRRTQPERLRRASRDLEHRILIAMDAEDQLRRMLVEDLRQIVQRHEAIEYAREHYGIEIQWPAT